MKTMNSKLISLIVFGVLVISTACASGQIETMIEDQANTISEQLSNEGIQLQQEGIGPLEITPLPPGEQHTAPPVQGDGGNINSRGQISTSAAPGGEPGMSESKAPSGITLEGEVESVISWRIYQDQEYPFSIAYPAIYAILPAEIRSETGAPELLHQVRFLDRQLASGDTADLEIPNFRIEIYDLGNLSLETFLDENFDRGNREPFNQGGAIGIRVFFDQMIAPNEFYYFADQSFVYKLTPNGEYSQEMLASFQIQ
jgi:hypothetical protein